MNEEQFRKQYYSSGRFSQKDANILGPAIEQLAAQKGGRITAADVVEAARAEDSPFHRYIEWDDAKAAEEHRLAQGRQILTISVRDTSGPTPQAGPIMINISSDRQKVLSESGKQRSLGNYVLVADLRDRFDEQRVALEDAKRMLLGATKRLRMLEGLFKSSYQTAPALFTALEAFAQEVEAEQVLAKAA